MRERIFADRREAGRALAAEVAAWFAARPGRDDPVVLALPRGGAPIGLEIARALGAPLDLALVRKLGAPSQPELAIGAVMDGATPTVARNEAILRGLRVGEAEFAAATRAALDEIARRRALWLGDRPPVAVAGRDVVVADDGAATGATALAALTALRPQGPRSLLFAAPTAAEDAARRLRTVADAAIVLVPLDPFHAIGQRYEAFPQLGDAEVSAALAEAGPPPPASSP